MPGITRRACPCLPIWCQDQESRELQPGYKLTELVAAAELDMQWHTLPASAPVQQPDAFEKQALEKTHVLLSAVPPATAPAISAIFGAAAILPATMLSVVGDAR